MLQLLQTLAFGSGPLYYDPFKKQKYSLIRIKKMYSEAVAYFEYRGEALSSEATLAQELLEVCK